MTSQEQNKKHSELKRAARGVFHRNEWAVYGTTCEEIHSFVDLVRGLFPDHNIGYADESHQEKTNENFAGTTWRKQQETIELKSSPPDNFFQKRIALSPCDAVIANGNHFEATTQIVICNPSKESSLRKRKEQLQNVVALILPEGENEIPAYIHEVVPSASSLPLFFIHDKKEMMVFISSSLLKPPSLKALVLAGGKSTRMGEDKPWMNYHGLPQLEYLVKELKAMNIETFVSCREDQKEKMQSAGFDIIPDRMLNMGPLGGIASAFMSDPDSAWLIIASDMPLMNKETIRELLSQRRPQHDATSFISPHDGFPEPLAAIWEPSSYMAIMQFISLGYSCPRKVLINSDTHFLQPLTPESLSNANTPEDAERLRTKLAGQ